MMVKDATGSLEEFSEYKRNSIAAATGCTPGPITDLGSAISIFDAGFAYPDGNSELLKAVKDLKKDLEKEVKALVVQYNKAVDKKPATQTQATQ